MQQSKWALEYFQPRVVSYHAELQRSFRSQVVKLTCLYHGFATTVPIEKLEGHSWLLESMRKEEKLPYMAILRRIEFSSEPYDEHIIFALKNGYSDLDALSRVMDGLNAQHKNQDGIAEIRSIWNLITSNFQADINAIVTRATEVLDRHCLDAPLDLVSETVRLLKMADSSNWDTYIEKAVLNFIPEAHEESLSSVKTYSNAPKVTEAIEKRRMQLAEKLDIEGLLTAVAGSDSWNSADYSRLDQFADRDFEKFLKDGQPKGGLYMQVIPKENEGKIGKAVFIDFTLVSVLA